MYLARNIVLYYGAMLHRLALLWHYDVVAGEFAQPLSGLQDGFSSHSFETKSVVYSKETNKRP